MKEQQILSTPGGAPAAGQGRRRTPTARSGAPALLVFDACQVGVVLRAVLLVEAVVGVVLLFGAPGLKAWLTQLATLTSGILPATLLWLVVGCALKGWLARGSLSVQVAAGIGLGALAGLYACAMLELIGLAGRPAPWLASACAGALMAAALVAGLVWRVRGRVPAATTARLTELQARIRPHFLFNTLNSAIALVREEPAKAERILEDLADLFRHALTESGDSASLAQELALARRYLEIEQVRFGPRLRVHWALDGRADAARLPPLILQPLVENAVKHGVEPSEGGADLKISTERRGSTVVVKVSNTVPAGQGVPGHGMAQANVRDRLRLLHDLQGSLRVGLVDGVYHARIEVPMFAADSAYNGTGGAGTGRIGQAGGAGSTAARRGARAPQRGRR